jgi:HD superfamily phosphohydrolase
MLCEKMGKKGKPVIAKNLKDNMNNIMAAGFLHDLAHAPFSHAADLILKKVIGKSHEDLAEEIIRNKIPGKIEDWGINRNSVIQMIKTKGHRNKFLGQIINGPLDSDKLDYLLRDAYHVGLRYSFDLNHFLKSYTVIGEDSDLSECILGLDKTKRAIVTSELFIMIWKSMYDMVYLVEQSRISEKMLEKAFLLSLDKPAIKEMFQIDNFVETNDESMLAQLRKLGPEISDFLASDDPRRIYPVIFDKELNQQNFKQNPKFLAMLGDPDELSENLSLRLSEELKISKYHIICDIIKTKAPQEIYLDNDSEKNEILLRNNSDIISVIKSKSILKVYAKPTIIKELDRENMEKVIKTLVEGEIEIG